MKDLTFDYSKVRTMQDLSVIKFGSHVRPFFKFETGKTDIKYYGTTTVLIPCYNKSHYVENAVKSCINQTVKVNVLVLLMDDESRKIKPILESYPNTTCICKERMNVCEARTFLVKQCKTDWFVFLDADDLLSKDYVEVLSQKKGAIRYAACRYVDSDENYDKEAYKNLEEILCLNNTCLMHKNVFLTYGYDLNLQHGGEDTDFSFRVLSDGKWLTTLTNDTYFVYQLDTENQLTKNWEQFQLSVINMYIKNSADMLERVKRNKGNSLLEWVLTDCSAQKFFLYNYLPKYNQNFKRTTDRFAINLYEETLKQSESNNTECLTLYGGRVFSIEDMIEKSDLLPDYIFPEITNKIDRLFAALENYKCKEVGVYSKDIKQVSNKDFLEWASICQGSNSLIGVFTKVLTKLNGSNWL